MEILSLISNIVTIISGAITFFQWIDKKEMESAIDYGGGEIIINSV